MVSSRTKVQGNDISIQSNELCLRFNDMPNYMLIAADILPILGFVKGWQPASVSRVNGPYFAG